MFRNQHLAEQVRDIMLEVSSRLDQSVALVRNEGTTEEIEQYRRCVGQLLGTIGLDVLNEIFRRHAELKPPGYMLPEDFAKRE